MPTLILPSYLRVGLRCISCRGKITYGHPVISLQILLFLAYIVIHFCISPLSQSHYDAHFPGTKKIDCQLGTVIVTAKGRKENRTRQIGCTRVLIESPRGDSLTTEGQFILSGVLPLKMKQEKLLRHILEAIEASTLETRKVNLYKMDDETSRGVNQLREAEFIK